MKNEKGTYCTATTHVVGKLLHENSKKLNQLTNTEKKLLLEYLKDTSADKNVKLAVEVAINLEKMFAATKDIRISVIVKYGNNFEIRKRSPSTTETDVVLLYITKESRYIVVEPIITFEIVEEVKITREDMLKNRKCVALYFPNHTISESPAEGDSLVVSIHNVLKETHKLYNSPERLRDYCSEFADDHKEMITKLG